MAADAPPDDLIGTTLAGRYRVLDRLGEGGMATVYTAHHLTLDAKVAVKVLNPALARDVRQRKRFVREARSANRIVHEHVVNIFDFAEEPTPYFVMEYLDGEDLAAIVERGGRLPWPRVCGIARQVLSALDAAHRLGIVHRDIKPSNIFLVRRPDGRDWIKVLDFGVAKVEDSSPDTRGMTRTNEVLGTVLYMSPEQALGEPVDLRSDVYSFGVVLHQLLSGNVPFTGTNPFQIIHKHLGQEPPPLPEDCPPALADIVRCALQKSPDARFATAQAMGFAVEQLAPPTSASFVQGVAWAGEGGPPRSFTPPPSERLIPPTSDPRASQWIFTGSSTIPQREEPSTAGTAFSTTTLERHSALEHQRAKGTPHRWLVPLVASVVLVGVSAWWLSSRSPASNMEAAAEGTVAPTLAAAPPRPAAHETATPSSPTASPTTPSSPTAAPAVPGPTPAPATVADTVPGPTPAPATVADTVPGLTPAPADPERTGEDPPTPVAAAKPSSGRNTARSPAARTPKVPSTVPQPPASTTGRRPSAPSDASVLRRMEESIVSGCSRHDPGARPALELEITREGKAYPEIHDVNAAAKACIRDVVRHVAFPAGKSRSQALRVLLRK